MGAVAAKKMSWEDDDWEEAELEAPEPAKKAAAPKEEWDDDDDSEDEAQKPFVPESKPKDVSKKPTSKIKSKKDIFKKSGKGGEAVDEEDGMSAAERKLHRQ